METVRQVLERSQAGVIEVNPDTTVLDALQLMAERNIGSVLVTENDNLVGILTERHYARNVVLKGRQSANTPVRDVMSTELYPVAPDQKVSECMAMMTDKQIRHLPVMKDERLIGIVSIGDLVRSTITEQAETIQELTRYING